MNINQIERIIPDGNQGYTLYGQENHGLVTVSKKDLTASIEEHERVSNDPTVKIGRVTEYVSNADIIISSIKPDDNVNYQIRFGSPKNEVIATIEAPLMISMLKIIWRQETNRLEGKSTKYHLNKMKSMEIDERENTYTIWNEVKDIRVTLPLIALAYLKTHSTEIENDLEESSAIKKLYWSRNCCKIKRDLLRNFNTLIFENAGQRVSIRVHTFRTLLRHAVEDSASQDELERLTQLEQQNNLSLSKNIKFFYDGRRKVFKIEQNGQEPCRLPITALDALMKSQDEIYQDFEIRESQEEQDYLHEYWTDGEYAIRTALFQNSVRNIDENVLRFVRLSDNFYMYSIKKETFEKLLSIYTEEKKRVLPIS